MERNMKSLSVAEVKFWLSEASSCVARQRVELVQRNNYPFLINYYEGVEVDAQNPHIASNQQMAIINEYFPSTNSLISELMYSSPDILLEAMKPQAEEDLPLMKSALTYLFDKGNGLIENRIALFDMLYAGYCAVEVDQLNTKKETEEEEPQEIQEEKASVFDKFKKGFKKALDPDQAERILAQMSPQIESNFSTVQGTYIRRYDPIDIPLDWRAERLKDCRYRLKKVWMSKAEFDVRYPKYKNQVDTEEEKFEHSKHLSSLHNSKVMLFEFQVRLKGGVYRSIIISPHVLTNEIDMFDRPYTTDDFNIKIGTLHKYGKLYPKSFAQINKTMQDEMNEYVRHMKDVAERNVPKHVIDKTKVKIDGKDALRSRLVNDLVEVDGNTTGAVTPLQPTQVAYENKELLSIFQDQKNKLWSVTEARISGRSQAEFATDLAIQDQSFQQRNVDIQEGLRFLIKDELNTGKDLIVNFWDNEVFLKVTGSEKMDWYEPVLVADPENPERQIVDNPLTDLLVGDYSVDIDIASSVQPNRSQELQRMFFFMTQLVQIRQLLIDQGKDINIEEIKRISKEFGWNPDKLFVEHQPQMQPNVPTAGGETISPEEDAGRQAEAEARVDEGAGGAI